MTRTLLRFALVLALGLFIDQVTPVALANTIYTYTGNPFDTFPSDDPLIPGHYSPDNHVVITLEMDHNLGPNASFTTGVIIGTPLPLIHYTFTDGRITYSS